MNFNIDLEEAVGLNYDDFLYSKKRYLACKGSRGSKKSCTTALKIIYFMMKYSGLKPNTLVIRKYFNTHKNSTRAQLIWAIDKLGVRDLWNIPKGELTLTFKLTGQQILFRGMDDPQSITSITVPDGYLCWTWIEESFQITKEEDFNKLDMSIRGQLPSGLFHQFILTFNPWSDRHWLKARFFDNPDENTLAITTNYMMNEFLSESDIRLYEIMKERYPRRYRIEGLGEWGIAEGLIFENWHEEDFDIDELIEKNRGKRTERGLTAFVQCCGIDFGYTDATAFTAMYVDRKDYKIYIYFELYGSYMENKKIANALIDNGFGNAIIYGDSEDPRTIRELQLLSVTGIRPVKKGAGSVLSGIQKLQDFEIIVHPRCQHTIESLCNYAWEKDRLSGAILPKPEHEFSHIPDSIRYACSEISKFGLQV